MIRGLRPAVLEELGLVPAIEALAAEVQDRSGLCSRVLTDGTDLATSVGPELEGTLYRIEQELLTNVVRHAKATAATIMLSSSDGWVRLVVQDNGRGFNIGVLPPKAQFGLRGVRERAELLGGRIEFQSEPGKGTIVTVSLPITPASLRKDSEVSPQSPTSVAGRKRRRHGK
jgi:signal transduction histidine kinase